MKTTTENPCLKHNCSECCKPVKMNRGYDIHRGEKEKALFTKRETEYWIPESDPDTVKL